MSVREYHEQRPIYLRVIVTLLSFPPSLPTWQCPFRDARDLSWDGRCTRLRLGSREGGSEGGRVLRERARGMEGGREGGREGEREGGKKERYNAPVGSTGFSQTWWWWW